jgi:hypothetical protein
MRLDEKAQLDTSHYPDFPDPPFVHYELKGSELGDVKVVVIPRKGIGGFLLSGPLLPRDPNVVRVRFRRDDLAKALGGPPGRPLPAARGVIAARAGGVLTGTVYVSKDPPKGGRHACSGRIDRHGRRSE